MSNSLYISTIDPGSGKALVALGIIESLLRKTSKVGFFRPIINQLNSNKPDEDIELIINHFHLHQTYEESYGILYQEANELIAQHKNDQLLEIIIAKYKQLEKSCDFIICEGSDYTIDSSAFNYNINTEIAKTLGSFLIILVNGYKKPTKEVINSVELAVEMYQENDCPVLGVIINQANQKERDEIEKRLTEKYQEQNYLIGVIPYNENLDSPRLKDIAEQLDAEILYGKENLDRLVPNYIIAAMQMQHAITKIKEGCLAITPGDRGDIIIGMLQANQSVNYPNLSGILLSTGLKPEPSIIKLIEGLHDPLPILSVKTDTYDTVKKVNQVHSSLTIRDTEKIALCIKMFDTYMPLETLEKQINQSSVRGITPKMFTYNLMQQAKANKQHIVLPEGLDPRILKATGVLIAQDIVDITLLGKKAEIEQNINKYGIQLDLNKVNIINPSESEKVTEYSSKIYELRKHKGMTPEIAQDYALDSSYFGTMMVYTGDADGMVSGAIHTTQHTIRPALQLIKTRPGFSIVSSVFLMCLEDRVLVYGDCAVNSQPTSEELAEIAVTSAHTASTFGIEPRVAMLSYSSGSSGKGEAVEKVRKATEIAKQLDPNLQIEGPIQYDAAVDATVAAQKMPGSMVAGKATVLIFPDLNTGNNTYKAVQRETRAIAIGPVLQGLRKPVNDLSRGCTVSDIINTVVITAIQGQNN